MCKSWVGAVNSLFYIQTQFRTLQLNNGMRALQFSLSHLVWPLALSRPSSARPLCSAAAFHIVDSVQEAPTLPSLDPSPDTHTPTHPYTRGQGPWKRHCAR